MSAKWRRSLAWDDEVFPGWAWPAKWLLRTLSSIWLGVSLLVCVGLYGVLASVPIGQLAQIPTWLVYIGTVVLTIAVCAGVPTWGLTRLMARERRGLRFLVWVFGLGVLGAASFWAWHHWAWPRLDYDPITGKGLRLLGDFSDKYRVITWRRLPGMEMSEVEFYAWWPLRLILLTFVLNMVVATVRRIEFNFKNIGVISVHTGIVLISLGSVYYSGNKLEGDTILFSGTSFDSEQGVVRTLPPQPQDKFYDYTRSALYIFGERSPSGRVIANEQRLITGLPRYNGYGLGSVSGKTVMDTASGGQPWATPEDRPLSLELKPPPNPELDRFIAKALTDKGLSAERVRDLLLNGLAVTDQAQHTEIQGLPTEVVSDLARRAMGRRLTFTVVGYAPYATVYNDFALGSSGDEAAGAVRILTPDAPGTPLPAVALVAGVPAKRVFDVAPDRDNPEYASPAAVEYTLGPTGGMTQERWDDLKSEVPENTPHALVVHVPDGKGGETRMVIPATQQPTEIGGTGWVLAATEVRERPELGIVTEGFKGATSSQIKLAIRSPKGEVFTRTIFSRFPELTQDFLPSPAGGRPTRRAPDPGIRIAYIDAARESSVFVDEPEPGKMRAIVRLRGGSVSVYENLFDDVPYVLNGSGLKVTRPGVGMGEVVERPAPVPEQLQNREFIGTHAQAMIAVRVGLTREDGSEWSKVVWLEFDKYALETRDEKVRTAEEIARAAAMGVPLATGVKARTLTLPDGRTLTLTFGRLFHFLPDMTVTLRNFEMIAYDHRGAPRDYQSLVDVSPKRPGAFEPYEHIISLNYPLTAPFFWSDSRGVFANVFGRLAAGLNPRQFKFSQAGWDNSTWRMSQQLVDQKVRLNDGKVLEKPFVGYTVLQVGNSPGIHIIALGAISMGMGIPWAFYVKPWLVRREKRRIQEQLAAGTYVRPAPPTAPSKPAPAEASV